MKKLFLVGLFFLSACGGGGQNTEPSISGATIDRSNFTGDYSLRGADCNPAAPKKIRFIQTGDKVDVLIIDGNGFYKNGDKGAGVVEILQNGVYRLHLGAWPNECFFMIISQEELESTRTRNVIEIEANDLYGNCDDQSADTLCAVSYQKN